MPEEFIKYFDICNDYEMYVDIKKEFYELKTLFLKKYASFAGYDLQVFDDYTIGCFGEIYTVSEKYAYKVWNKGKCSEPRWNRTHKHILERYELFYENKGVKKSKIYHIPTNEFWFKCSSYIKCSDNFEKLKEEAINKVGLKHQKIRRGKPSTKQAFTWLQNYIEINKINLEPLQLELNLEEHK